MPLADAYRRMRGHVAAPAEPTRSRWYHYQAIVTPAPGTRIKLYLYADVYKPELTTNEYSDVVVRRFPVLLQPVVVATPQKHQDHAPALYTVDGSFSPDWVGPPGDKRVEVDGLRSGWLGPHSGDTHRASFRRSGICWSRIASLLAASLMLALALPSPTLGLGATVRASSGGHRLE